MLKSAFGSRSIIRLLITLTAVIASTRLASAETVKISAILVSPSSYDTRHVTVSGAVIDVVKKTSAKGNPYETFRLCDEVCIRVFTFGQPTSVTDGKQITVNGVFSATKRVGQYMFHNEIDADDGSL